MEDIIELNGKRYERVLKTTQTGHSCDFSDLKYPDCFAIRTRIGGTKDNYKIYYYKEIKQ